MLQVVIHLLLVDLKNIASGLVMVFHPNELDAFLYYLNRLEENDDPSDGYSEPLWGDIVQIINNKRMRVSERLLQRKSIKIC
jgi:hypothetical protein